MTPKKKSGSRAQRRFVPAPIAWITDHAHLAMPFGILLVIACAVGYGVWNRYGGMVVGHHRYELQPRSIEINEPPEWLESDVLGEVIRLAGLPDSLNALEPELGRQLADAFHLHPWVKRVVEVQILPTNRAVVEIEYHQPACMIEVEGGFLPVNQEGVLLPTAGVAPLAAANFPRLGGIESDPAGPIGSHWGDTHVDDAAKIATALAPYWTELKLRRMLVAKSSDSPRGGTSAEYEIETRDQIRVLWGHAPGAEVAGESTAAEKVEKLVRFRGQQSSQAEAVGSVIDVRPTGEILPVERTAARVDEEVESR